MPKALWEEIRQRVYERAGGCCEYCQTCETNTGQTMQVDHIDPHGSDDLENLCLSCWSCNNYKRRATHVFDPQTETEVALFHPRTQFWNEHFEWVEEFTQIQGRTPTGRATIVRLKMNRPVIVVARQRWVEGGYHPPSV
ncbi:MAG: HNH endonuclease signature motif containing protein [Chloroflexota bacterium]